MLCPCNFAAVVVVLATLINALRYDADQASFNLNENKTALDPLDYWGEWADHTFFPSPSNWRMPMYTMFLDRFVNGDPSNDNANGTQFEHDLLSNQLRNGGDIKGLQDTLDYLQGMGIRLLYLAGSPMINMPWGSDGYSPLDLTLLDRHMGTIAAWREAISEIHQRGMYVVLDNTFSTLGDLIGFEGYLNQSTPFAAGEHNVVWKTDRRYTDFMQSDRELEHCDYPRFYTDAGHRVTTLGDELVGCRDSEFDQYGEIAAFGNYPEWQRQLSKFAFVQDRLREWRPSVLAKIQHFSCMTIASLDIDGFRIDKALQITVDAQGSWSNYIRQCAKRYNKHNFFIPGEIVAGNTFGSIYLGRGTQPHMAEDNLTKVVAAEDNNRQYVREQGHSALDAAAFHYTVYRALTRFLGIDGVFAADGDPPVNFVETWTTLMQTNDMANADTGIFDPRHMYGVVNQDVFRWPSIQNGTEKDLLGLFIVTLLFPGIPTLSWGEEQAFYILDSTASNYVFGRAPMTSSLAWQIHGCYKVGNIKYYDWPVDAATYGCEDDNISLDHRDPSHPVRNIIKRMFELREVYPVLNDGFYLQQLSNHTYDIYLPGSDGTPTETGLWSVYRSSWAGVQNLTQTAEHDQSIWLLFSNQNSTANYEFNCSNNDSLVSPFVEGTTVKNLFPPYEEYTLERGPFTLGFDGDTQPNGCLSAFSMPAWGYKALVPTTKFAKPRPVLTSFLPGHDYRIQSSSSVGDVVRVTFGFSTQMDCDSISNIIRVNSTVADAPQAAIDLSSANCSTADTTTQWVGEPSTAFTYEVDLRNVYHGIHQITLKNASSTDGSFMNAVDTVLFRIGDLDNPMVFPRTANYSRSLLFEDGDGLYVSHHAPGADLWRYSLNFGTTYSNWLPYTGKNDTLAPMEWSGTSAQAWDGHHVITQYWSQMSGSSSHYQHGDLDFPTARRFPNLWIEGAFNQYGFDAGLSNQMELDSNATWSIDFQAEWPARISLNAWGINPDGQPDVTQTFGDIDGDNILDRIPPVSLVTNTINITGPPPSPFLAYRVELDDGSFRYQLIPIGSRWTQLVLYVLLTLIPLLSAITVTVIYMNSFYQVKFNQYGATGKTSTLSAWFRGKHAQFLPLDQESTPSSPETPNSFVHKVKHSVTSIIPKRFSAQKSGFDSSATRQSDGMQPQTTHSPVLFGATIQTTASLEDVSASSRRTVLIATMEYDIEDWNIKIKIGGLGVMTQLMGKYLTHNNLIWIVPCVGGVDYPEPEHDGFAEPMEVTILGTSYLVQVQTHVLRNITYVLLDAPVFRKQTKAEPYPPRMDDIESAIYYSTWNSCIAEGIRRYHPDLYHINDYHGCIAPLHLLPDTIPCALSLHNAEFQGLWPIRTKKERDEVCKVYNLDQDVVHEYVQYGEVFNMLHAGASYLRKHQNGFGAVGVSTKYGKRSYARYPIFWRLPGVGALPNPDPSDLAAWSRSETETTSNEVAVNAEFEANRGALREEAQKWANLNVDASAELFVFVGRWSMQKGVDLIADIFPTVLEKHPKTQLICVGPVIDLYGKFAAIKLAKMMEKYPGRVYSNPTFTALPPYIFSGAEFALIPSRDEPFGLVAVEFGRKGAIGVGARVGGLGQMPGWWYTIESTSTTHLLHQFKGAIEGALASKTDVRATLRARSSRQRFPVARWVQELETLQSTAIKQHQKHAKKHKHRSRLTKADPSTAMHSVELERGLGIISGAGTPTSLRSGATTPAIRAAHSRSGTSTPVVRTVESNFTHPWPELPAIPSRPESPTLPAGSEYHSRFHEEDLGTRVGPGHQTDAAAEADDSDLESRVDENELYGGPETFVGRAFRDINFDHLYKLRSRLSDLTDTNVGIELQDRFRGDLSQPQSPTQTPPMTPRVHGSATPMSMSEFITPPNATYSPHIGQSSHPRMVSTDFVVGEKKDFKLQRVDPFFTDPEHDYEAAFSSKLVDLNGKNTYETTIEEFVKKSEKDWFNRLRGAKMGKTSTPVGSIFQGKTSHSTAVSVHGDDDNMLDGPNGADDQTQKQFLLADDYKPPTGIKKLLLHRLGDWPVYSLLLAFGQVIAANSYQITLLTGEVGEASSKLYTIASIYLATSVLWWFVYRKLRSIWVLSLPFVFYGLAFLLIGLTPLVSGAEGKKWMQNVAAACYATASSSGSLFFALNFGDQGGAPVRSWVFRAAVIQGTQQVYIAFLWCWGAAIARMSAAGDANSSLVISQPALTIGIGATVAVLMWIVGGALFLGLPDYYRQTPGYVPGFLAGVFRRKIVLWFFFAVIIQNFFLSAPYGRNWLYLWSSQHLPTWATAIMVLLFFIAIWAALLHYAGHLSKQHSWLMPIFAIGLGAPRWCQMLWAVSGIGQYVPWALSPVGSAIAGRTLWLWLGVLDSVQSVGFGMIMLHTLTRFHISFALVLAQVLGSLATILARAVSPDRLGPGPVFPDFGFGVLDGLRNDWFWVALLLLLSINVLGLKFFRKEQLSKP